MKSAFYAHVAIEDIYVCVILYAVILNLIIKSDYRILDILVVYKL